MLQPHERVALRRLAQQIEARDPGFARQLSVAPHGVSLRAVKRALARALRVATTPLVAVALLTIGLVDRAQVVMIVGAVLLCVALPVSLWTASRVNRTWRP